MNENNIKWVDVKILNLFNELSQGEIYMDYFIENLTPNAKIDKNKSYYCIYKLNSILYNSKGEKVFGPIGFATIKHGTEVKVPSLNLQSFYDRILKLGKEWYTEFTLSDLWKDIVEDPLDWNDKFLAERSMLMSINSVKEELFKKYNNEEMYIDFSELDETLSSNDYFGNEKIKLFMAEVNKKFTEKENNNQDEDLVFDDYNELENISYNVILNNARKNSVKTRKKIK